MPTGYTAAVAYGKITDLRSFALNCARGMGACIAMRDAPMDAPIPQRFEPSTKYHDDKLAEARAELAALVAMSPAEAEAAMLAEYEAALTGHNDYLAEKRAQAARYDAMIAQVEDWSTGAAGIKSFMLSQLRESRDFDCNERYVSPAPERPTDAEEWRVGRRKKLAKDIGYHEEQRANEIARTEERNGWLAALFASLPTEPSQPVKMMGEG